MLTSLERGVWLWLSLAFPSLYIVDKYAGLPAALLYAVLVAGFVAVSDRLAWPRHERFVPWLALAALLVVAAAFFIVHPRLNVHVPGAGSDDDDAYNLGALALAAGVSPYTRTTYLGNVLHQLPGAFVLAAPFVALGTSALQNLFWLPLFFGTVARGTGDRRLALRLAGLVLILSPTVMHQLVTGTGYVSNAIYVALGLWWLVRSRGRPLAALFWGVALASRANFLFLVPLAFGWLWRSEGRGAALRAIGLTVVTAAVLTLPFYLNDPANFGPLEASDRVFRFEGRLPGSGFAIVGMMACAALMLTRWQSSVSALFRNAAIVQAIPVLAGMLLGILLFGQPDLSYSPYGTFFAWFALAAIATSAGGEHENAQTAERIPS